MNDGEVSQPTTFRGGIAHGVMTATWPFGRLSIATDHLRISWPLGLRSIDVTREDIDELVIRRVRFLGPALKVKSIGRPFSETAFFPTNPGKVADALEAKGWPVRVDLRRPKWSPAIYLVCAIVLLLLALGEVVIRLNQADTIKSRSVTVETTIESIQKRGGKRYGTVSYSVGSSTYGGKLPLDSSQHLREQIAIAYDPEKPSRFWEQGDDPPGTDEFWFGLGIIPALFLIRFSVQQRRLRRYLDSRPGP